REHERVIGRESYSLVRRGERTIKVSFVNEHETQEPVGKPRDLRGKMLIGKDLTSEVACFSNLGRWIITDEDDHTNHMVPAQFHFEERRTRKLRQSFSPNLARPLDPLLGVFYEVVVPTKIIVILLKCRRTLPPRLPILRLLQCARLTSHGTHDHSSDFVLECPRVHARPVKTLGPNMLASLRVDELGYDSKLVAVFAYAAFEHVANAKFSSDLPDIDRLVLVNEGGRARDHCQVREARERGNDIFSHPVTQIAKALVGTQIIERKNGYGGNSGGDFLCRRHLPPCHSRRLLVPKLDLRCVRSLWEINANGI